MHRHRGAPTLTERRRIAAGVTYSKRMISQRLFPHVDYRIPPHVLEGVRRPVSPLSSAGPVLWLGLVRSLCPFATCATWHFLGESGSEYVREQAGPRLQRFLGRHERMSYG